MNKLELMRQEMMHVRGQAESIYHDADAFLDTVDRMEYVRPDSPKVASYSLRAIDHVRSAMMELAGCTGRMMGIVHGIGEVEKPEEAPKSEEAGKFPWTTPLWMLLFLFLMLNNPGEKDSLCEKGAGCAASDGGCRGCCKK